MKKLLGCIFWLLLLGGLTFGGVYLIKNAIEQAEQYNFKVENLIDSMQYY